MSKRSFSSLAMMLLVPAPVSGAGHEGPRWWCGWRSGSHGHQHNIKLIVQLASGKENVAQQIEGLIKTKIGPNGLEGIYLKRPFGDGRIGKEIEDVAGVIMLPIADHRFLVCSRI